jgi:ankyrin repeat protein
MDDTETLFAYLTAGDLMAAGQLLAREPALIDARDAQAWTPPHYVADRGWLDLMTWLIAHGADVHAVTNEGETPLFFAANPAKVDGNTAACIRMLLEAGADINHRNGKGWTPLHDAAFYGEVAESAVLLDLGAAVDARGARGETPLHLAAGCGLAGEVALLLARGAEVNARAVDGFTPLHYVVGANIMPHTLTYYLETANTLLAAGVDLTARTHDGQTPLMLARRQIAYPELAALLIGHGAAE